jgi:hypothetical protein
VLDHHAAVTRNPLAMKRGLNQAPLPQMGCALARQQSLAKQLLGAFQTTACADW